MVWRRCLTLLCFEMAWCGVDGDAPWCTSLFCILDTSRWMPRWPFWPRNWQRGSWQSRIFLKANYEFSSLAVTNYTWDLQIMHRFSWSISMASRQKQWQVVWNRITLISSCLMPSWGPTECTVNVTMLSPWDRSFWASFLSPSISKSIHSLRCLVPPGSGAPSIGEPVVGMQLYVVVPWSKDSTSPKRIGQCSK